MTEPVPDRDEPVQTRVLEATDVEAYRDLRLASLRESPFAFSESLRDQEQRGRDDFAQAIAARGTPPHSFTLGIDHEGQLAGVITFARDHREWARHKAQITAMYVAPVCRAKGWGRVLVEEAIERGRDTPGLELVHLWALIAPDASSAVGFYEGLGFVVCGVARHDLIIQGRSVDGCYMTRDLRLDAST